MKIGDEVYIHGYIDEIRKDVVIIKNDGGYFGTVPSEIIACEKESVLDKIRAEIRALSNSNPSYWHSGDMVDRDDVLEIIDKYKSEIEG